MSTIKSSAEHLTINADGAGKDIILQNNGSTKLTVKSGGNVGIGTSSPSVPLHVSSSVAGDVSVLLENTNSTNGFGVKIKGGGNAADRYSLRVDSQAGTELFRVRTEGGISFNGDTAAANALDSYEEGTWTPEFRGSTGSAGSSATTTYGATYTKIGNVVNVEFYGRWSDVGSWTGDLHLYGLPYAHEASTRSVGVSAGLKKVEMPDSLPFVPIMIAGNSHLHFNRQISDLGAKAYAQTSYFDDALNELVMSLTYRT